MSEILNAFFHLVIWVTVPALSAGVLVKLYTVSHGAGASEEHHASMRAGFWGGLALFLIIFVAQVGRFFLSGFPQEPIYQGFNTFLAIGAAIGMFALLHGKRAVRSRLIGWLVLGIAALALWTLFHYLFIRTANEYILSLALGAALGICGYAAFLPMKRTIKS